MATIKSYTDLEQSKVLSKILPLESADMFYEWSNKEVHFKDDKYNGMGFSCWSLAALINVLPDTITSNDGIAFELNTKKNIVEYSNPSLYLVYKSVKSDSLIDACVVMIEKLNELKLL